MSLSDVGIELENYEIFNKISNGEPIMIIQFLRNLIKIEEQQLKKAVVFTYSQVLDIDFDFMNFIDQIFPFLSKASANYSKVLRKVLLFFGYNEETNPEDEFDNRKKIVEKFEKFVLKVHGRFVSEDDDGESSPKKVVMANNDSTTNQGFKVQLYLSKSIFEEFFDRYVSCYAIFNWSQFQLLGKIFVDYYPNEIISNFLFLGDYYSANKKERLLSLQITHVIDASNAYISEEASKEAGIEYLPVNIWDDESVNIKEHFNTVIEFIDQAKDNHPNPHILIHCRAGISRSSSFVLAYLMKKMKMSLKDSLIHVVKQRPVVLPNEGFRQQLYDYEIELFGKSSLTSVDESLELIHQHSRLFSSASTLENAFDRIPIRASTSNKIDWSKAYPEGNPDLALDENQKLDGNVNPLTTTVEVKPKKPFLKRGEGKTVHQEFVKQKKLEIEKRKKELREKKNLLVGKLETKDSESSVDDSRES
eukprot:gene5181-5549_t